MDVRALLMGLSFAIVWASAFASSRIIVLQAPPLTSLALRFAISGVLAILLARFLGQSWRGLTRSQWRAVVILGLCQNALYLGLNWVAMQWIEAGLASIIAATMPLMVAAFGWVFLGERLRPMGIAGLFLGLAGVAIIMSSRLQGGSDITGILMGFAAAVALAVATLTVRGASAGGNVMMIVGLQMLVGAVSLAFIAPFVEDWQVTVTPVLAVAFIYTVIMPGIVATWVWFLLVERIGAVRAATFHFLSPFFGVTIGALLLNEELGVSDMLGVAVIMAGILAVQLSRVKSVRRPPVA